MSEPITNKTPFDKLVEHLRGLKLDDGLIYLNFILQASQDPDLEQSIYEFSQEYPDAITDFKIEFLAKWLIVKSSFTSADILSPSDINWEIYLKLSELYNEIDDPIVGDPSFPNRNPVDVFIRMSYQQLPGQQRIPLESFGSAYLLFQEAGAKLAGRVGYDIPTRFEEVIGLSIEQFMQLGLIFSGGRAIQHKARGTISREYLKKGRESGLEILSDENVTRFLKAVSCNHEEFRALAAQEIYTVDDLRYVLYEFNPLKKRPLVQIHPDRWVAPNPDLIIDRVTFGILYDLLDADHTEFTGAFGLVFQEYVGDLLKSVYPPEKVFAEKPYGSKKQRKDGPADWTVIEEDVALLFECKSFIPSLDFVSIANQADVEHYAKRVADAVEQTYKHIAAIQAGETGLEEFAGLDAKVIVLTLGRVETVNTAFFKPEIDQNLANKGLKDPTYVVLSLQELEHLLSLVERGISLTDMLSRLENQPLQNALKPYKELISQNALPSIVKQKGEEVIRFYEKESS
jgi:hypothetical protein